jgi:hypothetical protein
MHLHMLSHRRCCHLEHVVVVVLLAALPWLACYACHIEAASQQQGTLFLLNGDADVRAGGKTIMGLSRQTITV